MESRAEFEKRKEGAMPEVLTNKSNFKAAIDAGESITESLIAANRAAAERERLEREVIEKAKEFTDDKEPRENWDALVAYRELCQAVDALLDFESNQREK